MSNDLAVHVMGWHVDSNDPRCLWRLPDGTPIDVNSMGYGRYFLCMMPWQKGVNLDEDFGFNPGTNHHKKVIDFCFIVNKAIELKSIGLNTDSIGIIQYLIDKSR